MRIKFNAEIFETLLKKQKAITIPADGLGIDIGNLAASNTLIKVCNPYCGPCAKAHPKIEELLEQNSNLKVKIIFTTTNQPDDRAYKPVSHLLAINENWYAKHCRYWDQYAKPKLYSNCSGSPTDAFIFTNCS